MKIRKKRIFIIVITVAILVFGIFKLMPKKVVKEKPQIYTVQKGNLELSYTGDGTVKSEKVMSVFATTNSTVQKVYYRIWQNVKKGDVLLDIDPSSIDVLNENIKIADLKYKTSKNKYEKNKELYKYGLISKNVLENSQLEYELSTIEKNKLIKEKNKVELSVKAPISGIITELNADDNYKIELSKPLFKIADTDNLKIVVSLPNVKAKNIRQGDHVLVSSQSLPNGVVLKGKVDSIEKISSIDREYKDAVTNINVKLDNNSTLKPGDLVNVKIIYKDLKDIVLIPNQYVLANKDGKPYVLEVKNNKLVKKDVELGSTNGFTIEVVKGLNKDDKILNNSNHQYKEGELLNDSSKESK